MNAAPGVRVERLVWRFVPMNNNDSSMAANAICHAAYQAGEAWVQAGILAGDAELARATPAAVFRPRLFIDGDNWCALYGDNLQDGVAGFGASPQEAMAAFDKAWKEPIRKY